MNTKNWFRVLALVGMLVTSAIAYTPASAQDGLSPAYPLDVHTAICPSGSGAGLNACTPWDGVFVTLASNDGAYSGSCTTAADVYTAICYADVPWDSTITGSIDPATVPAGYALEGSPSVTVSIPASSPFEAFSGPTFVLVPVEAPEEPEVPEVPVEEASFPLGAASAYCDPGYLGPFVDCTPWEGVTVSFASADGAFSATCTTAGTDRAAGCGVDVPFGSTITASIDPAMIPVGYVLEGAAAQEFTIPAGPPEGIFGGPVFVLLPAEVPVEPEQPVEEGSFPLGAASAFCEPGYLGPFEGCTPWEGLTVSFVSADGSFSASCVTAGTDRAAGCGVDVPFGSTITASIDPTAVPIDYILEGEYEQVFEIPAGPPEGEFGGAVFVLLPNESGGEDIHERPADDSAKSPAESEPVNDNPAVLKLPNTGTGPSAVGQATPWTVVAVVLMVVCGTGLVVVRRMR